MKLLVGAAVAALLIATSAVAQTGGAAPAAVAPSSCPAAPPAPTLPDGANADREGMEVGNTAFTTWATAMAANIACRRAEVDALHAQWQARVADHNAAAESLNTTNTAWQADVAEYNARTGRGGQGTMRH